jgi:hypothetical protein
MPNDLWGYPSSTAHGACSKVLSAASHRTLSGMLFLGNARLASSTHSAVLKQRQGIGHAPWTFQCHRMGNFIGRHVLVVGENHPSVNQLNICHKNKYNNKFLFGKYYFFYLFSL